MVSLLKSVLLNLIIEFSVESKLRIITFTFIDTFSNTYNMLSVPFLNFIRYLLKSHLIGLISFYPAAFVPNYIFVREFAYGLDLFHSRVLLKRFLAIWIEL